MTTVTSANQFPELWASYVNTGNLEKLIALYNETFILIPTFSPNNVNTLEQLDAYFEKLGSKESLSIDLEEDSINTQNANENTFIVTGNYAFNFKENGVLQRFPSRFTFVIDFSAAQPILHHHSSQMPNSLS